MFLINAFLGTLMHFTESRGIRNYSTTTCKGAVIINQQWESGGKGIKGDINLSESILRGAIFEWMGLKKEPIHTIIYYFPQFLPLALKHLSIK